MARSENIHRIFAVEGLDCAGKTTVSKLVAQQTGGIYFYPTDGNPLSGLRKFFDGAPVSVRFLYFVALPLSNYHRIERLRQRADVFVDRTIFSTIAYHKAYGLADHWFKLIPPFLLNQFDQMLYLEVSQEERVRRMTQRQQESGVLSKSDQKSLILGPQVDAEYRKLVTRKRIAYPTDHKTPQAVANKIIQTLYVA